MTISHMCLSVHVDTNKFTFLEPTLMQLDIRTIVSKIWKRCGLSSTSKKCKASQVGKRQKDNYTNECFC